MTAGTLVNEYQSVWMLIEKMYQEYGERAGIEYWKVYCVQTTELKVFGFKNGVVVYKGRVYVSIN